MNQQWNLNLADKDLSIETGKYAKQANGAVMARYGDTAVLVTATMSEPREGIDYFPLMVNYEERVYAIGKIPGSINRREGRPRDVATLAARVIDRPLRPLFPEGFRHDVQVIATVMSVDDDCEPDILAMNGASAALTLSDIPFDGPIGGVKVGLIEGDYVINPGEEQRENSKLDLTVAGTEDAVLMVEAGAEEVKEENMIEAIEIAHREIKEIVKFQKSMQKDAGKEKFEFVPEKISESFEKKVRNYVISEVEETIKIGDKEERENKMDEIKEEAQEHFTKGIEEENKEEKKNEISNIIDDIIKKEFRRMVTENKIRPG
ncbi:MAG: polyribonucleotide nucleotidyltransferase, partial [Bacillota bacterium]